MLVESAASDAECRRQPMTISIPPRLRDSILHEFGERGAAWLEALPGHVARLQRAWRLELGPPFDTGGAVSWVAPAVRADGSHAVLKISVPHYECEFEADALRLLDGRGAVRLLEAEDDGFSLLLERCLPGTDLWALDEEAGDDVACAVLTRFWVVPPAGAPFLTLAEVVGRWWEGLDAITASAEYPAGLVQEAVARSHALLADPQPAVLLHGDFHPGNVLAAQREPWLAIDPKPLTGEPAHDLAQWLANRRAAAIRSGDPVAALRRQIERFAGALDLEPARIAGWAFVKALGWEWGPDVLDLLHQVAQAWPAPA